MNDTTQTLIRAILKIGAGALVTKGITDQSTAEIITAGVAALIGVIWGILHKKPGPVTPAQSQPSPVKVLGLVALSLIPALMATGCAFNRQYATSTSTSTNGVVTVTVARSTTATIWDAKNTIDKTRASAGKTSTVGASGIDQESSGTNAVELVDRITKAAVSAAVGAAR